TPTGTARPTPPSVWRNSTGTPARCSSRTSTTTWTRKTTRKTTTRKTGKTTSQTSPAGFRTPPLGPRRLALVEPVHDAGHVGRRAADPLELGRYLRVGIRPEHRVALPGALGHHRGGVVEIHPRAARPAGLGHPDVDLRGRPVQRLVDVGDRPEVTE